MPLLALVDGRLARPERSGARRAACRDCGAGMLAKTGDLKVWHWAHEADHPDCASGGESEWHLQWKLAGPDGRQEMAVGNRRADVLAPGGFAVEFQKSQLSRAEVEGREADWRQKLVWIFDATEAREKRNLCLRHHPDRPADAYRNITWSWAPERVRAAKCATLLDLGNEGLVFVGKLYQDRSPLGGYGWLVTRDWVVAHVLYGQKIPSPPGYRAHVEHERVAALAAEMRRARQAAWVAARTGAEDRRASYAAQVAARGRFVSATKDLLQRPAPLAPRCAPRMWEPDAARGRVARLCADCGRVTYRTDPSGRPRCLGGEPPEPDAIRALRTAFHVDVLKQEVHA